MSQKRVQNHSDNYENLHGMIRFFDPTRKFGLIDSEKSEHIFFASVFRNKITQDEISESVGRNVTFSLTEDKKVENLNPLF
jgi:hypothetical protein